MHLKNYKNRLFSPPNPPILERSQNCVTREFALIPSKKKKPDSKDLIPSFPYTLPPPLSPPLTF